MQVNNNIILYKGIIIIVYNNLTVRKSCKDTKTGYYIPCTVFRRGRNRGILNRRPTRCFAPAASMGKLGALV